MLRNTLLYLSEMKRIQGWIMGNPLSRRAALRFVAGETRQEALEAARALNNKGIEASIDFLGENVSQESEARQALEEYLAVLDGIEREKVRSHVSIKLTALGLDISGDLCREHVTQICRRAKEIGTFVRIDMEGSAYTEATLGLYKKVLGEFDNVGLAIQAYLYRTEKDIEGLVKEGGKFRLCKGAYKEPGEIAHQEKRDVDSSYVSSMKFLLSSGTYHGLATHDPEIIQKAKDYAQENEIGRDAFEFQMLYGIQRDTQEAVARDYNMRVYIPYGTNWYPYLMRRLAERPANLWFVLKNLMR